MRFKLFIAVAAIGVFASIEAAQAQTRYSPPSSRTASARSVHYSRSSAVVMGEEYEGGCASCGAEGGCGECDACVSGCGRCCGPRVLGWVARGVGRVADCIGGTLDCLFPSSCCASPCGTRCCERRPACGRACYRRGCDEGCTGCASCGVDGMSEAPHMEEHHLSPGPAPAPAPAPTPEPSQGARQYRAAPPTRPTAVRTRNAAAPTAPAPAKRTTRMNAIPASAEEEVAAPAKAPRLLVVRPQDATRLRPIPTEEVEIAEEEEYVEEEYVVEKPVSRTSASRSSNSRIPTNPLRNR